MIGRLHGVLPRLRRRPAGTAAVQAWDQQPPPLPRARRCAAVVRAELALVAATRAERGLLASQDVAWHLLTGVPALAPVRCDHGRPDDTATPLAGSDTVPGVAVVLMETLRASCLVEAMPYGSAKAAS